MGKALAMLRKCAERGRQAVENEDLKKLEEALPRIRECALKKASRQSKKRSRMRWLPLQRAS